MTNKTFNTDIIYDYLWKNKLSKKEFCNLCNISYSTLNKILKDNINVRINNVFRISKVLEIDIYKMFWK